MNLRIIQGGAGKRKLHTETDLWREAADYWESQAKLWDRAVGVQVDRANKAERSRNRYLTALVLSVALNLVAVAAVWGAW